MNSHRGFLIRPCPFCGGCGELHDKDGAKYNGKVKSGVAWVQCANCSATSVKVPFDLDFPDENLKTASSFAVEKWNRRL